jgi:hypothetical protein
LLEAQVHNFEGIKFSYDYRLEKGHHRVEKRWCWAVPLEAFGGLYQQQQWLGLKALRDLLWFDRGHKSTKSLSGKRLN